MVPASNSVTAALRFLRCRMLLPPAQCNVSQMNQRAESELLRSSALEQSAFWMPYTANRQFKKAPRLLSRAEGMYYWTPEGRQVLDGTAGLWCVNAGHCRPKIVEVGQGPVGGEDFRPHMHT